MPTLLFSYQGEYGPFKHSNYATLCTYYENFCIVPIDKQTLINYIVIKEDLL